MKLNSVGADNIPLYLGREGEKEKAKWGRRGERQGEGPTESNNNPTYTEGCQPDEVT